MHVSKTSVNCALICLLAIAGLVRAEESWWSDAPSKYSDALNQIFDGDLATWSISSIYRKPTDQYTAEVIDGRAVLHHDERQNLLLTHNTEFAVDTEFVVQFRFSDVVEKKYANVQVCAAIKDITKSNKDDVDRVWVSTTYRGGTDTASWAARDDRHKGERLEYARGNYRADGIGDRMLSWPDQLRRIVEHEAAKLKAIEETIFTLRVRLHENAYQIWLNDMLLVDYEADAMDTTGLMQVSFSQGVHIQSLRINKLDDADAIFEPIAIGHAINASTINGQTISRTSLPEANQKCLVQDVPFIFPSVDEEGNDHIDLQNSWFQSAYLEGHLGGNRGPFFGRWAGAEFQNPARIQFRVRNGRYNAIHLIAAADDDDNSVPIITAQFYRPSAGHPVNAATKVPLFSARTKTSQALPVKLTNGRKGHLYHVTIPIDPGILEGFQDLDELDVELTKKVLPFRAYPDPSYYSHHAAGLPSSVHVYAMTFERAAVEMTVTPEQYAHIFTAPLKPTYTISLTSRDGQARKVSVTVDTVSFDGKETTTQEKEVNVTANGATAKFILPLERFGYHDITFKLTDGDRVWHEKLSLAHLHKDTRERGNWDKGRGVFFGAWNWGGGHHTPPREKSTLVHALAGGMGQGGTYQDANEATQAVAKKYGMTTLKHFSGRDHWITGAVPKDMRTMSKEEALAKMVEELAKIETKASPITKPWYVSYFPEPHVGSITHGALPSYYGEPPYQFEPHEEERYQEYLQAFLAGAPEIRKRWPDAKIMFPHGDPMFTVIFAQRNPEVRPFIDGVAVDVPVFERLPEQQIHQVTPHRMWMCVSEYKKAGILEQMSFPMFEGPCVPDQDGAVPWREAPALVARNMLVFIGYGVDQFCGAFGVFHAGNYWGEQHYGGGLMHRLPLERPKPMYAAYATTTRNLNARNFTKYIPTGSLSTYNMQFKHYADDSLTHVLWTIRGKRIVTLDVPAGAKLNVYDLMDNVTELTESGGQVSFEISPDPVFLQGATSDAVVTLGEPDHSDNKPAPIAKKISNLGDGKWKLSDKEDDAYAKNTVNNIHRFPAKMKAARVSDVPEKQGKRGLAVHFDTPEIDRVIMPYYTTLNAKRAITIPGKASHLGMWVKASSDWGRIVYSVRDAKGERWLSVGAFSQWNCDDTHNWSVFNFDGWRYLRFELPSNSPYDTFRERGSTWWGHSDGDGIVDLPLKLEKVFVERRTQAMYGNQPEPADMSDVILADLYAEYATESDMSRDTERRAAIRMPIPKGAPDLGNPIADLREAGTFESAGVTKITLPDQVADGTRCHVHFDLVEGAKRYDVWVSPYEDGRGALMLGKAWTESGKLIRGMYPETDFYLFLVVTDAEGNASKPSKPFKINLKDIFAMK